MSSLSKQLRITRISVISIKDTVVDYRAYYDDGESETITMYTGFLAKYRESPGLVPKVVTYAGRANCGIFKTYQVLLYIVTYTNGRAGLLQAREGSPEAIKLQTLAENTTDTQATAEEKPEGSYTLNKNELPQGKYQVGIEIPAGVYDFFVIHGTGGKFSKMIYDSNGKITDETWTFYWVGLKESYEHKELIHIDCQSGETIEIGGNVVLKIVRSQKVNIEL